MGVDLKSGARMVKSIGRRGIIGACLGLAAGLADRFVDHRPAQATHGPADATNALHLGQVNLTNAATTYLQRNASSGVALHVIENSPSGLGALVAQGLGSKIGIVGISETSASALFAGGLGVFIDGDLQVTGQKSAAVPLKDGELRRVYCMESPEAHFEDFGAADLVNGAATVRLDKEFNELVDGARYHVFLTPYGDCNGLFVARQGLNAFEVRELRGGKSSLRFSYRIVAPRGDGPRQRLPRTDRPDTERFVQVRQRGGR